MPTKLSPLNATAARFQGSELRGGRMAHGLTQQAAADLCRVPISAWRDWEYGHRQAPESVRAMLADAWKLDRGRLGLEPERACPCCGQAYG